MLLTSEPSWAVALAPNDFGMSGQQSLALLVAKALHDRVGIHDVREHYGGGRVRLER